MATSLAEYAASSLSYRSPGGATRWFEERPQVLEEVKSGLRSGLPPMVVWKWLKREHAYPCTCATLYSMMDRLAEANRE